MPKKNFQQIDFNPKLIISNIIILISIYYILQIFFTIFFDKFFGLNIHLDQILTDESLDFTSQYSSVFIYSLFFTYLLMIICFAIIVEKAKKILDFVLTNFFVHLVICTIYNGFPSKFLWWFINGVFITIVTLISEYITLKIEQKEIKLDLTIGQKAKIKK
jgi:hypothetical protein